MEKVQKSNTDRERQTLPSLMEISTLAVKRNLTETSEEVQHNAKQQNKVHL